MNVAEANLTHADELTRAERPPRQEKVEEVERIKDVLTGAAGIYLTDFRGIDVEKMNDLRLRFLEAGAEYTIVKNNLLKRAAVEAGLEGWIDDLVGPTAMAVGQEDPVAPAKVIKGFQDDHRRAGDFLVFKGGLLLGETIEVSTFKKLSILPGHDELIARLLFMLTYPMRGLVTVLSAVPGKLVYALDDLRKKRAAAEPAAVEEEPAAEEPAVAEEGIEDSVADKVPAEESVEASTEEAAEEASEDEIESGELDEPDKGEE
jgi:large subunit ribosomal protein L10